MVGFTEERSRVRSSLLACRPRMFHCRNLAIMWLQYRYPQPPPFAWTEEQQIDLKYLLGQQSARGSLNSGAAWTASRMLTWMSFVRVGTSPTLRVTMICFCILKSFRRSRCCLSGVFCCCEPDWELLRVRPCELCLAFCVQGTCSWTGWRATNCRSWCWSDSCHGRPRGRLLSNGELSRLFKGNVFLGADLLDSLF